MKLPNPYEKGNPMRYAVVPAVLLLLALALIFFKGVPAGIDLRGGVLLVVQTEGDVNLDSIKAKLAPLSSDINVRTFQGLGGKGVEIELTADPSLEEGQAKLSEARDLQMQLIEAEAKVNSLEGSTEPDAPQKLKEAQKARDEKADAVLAKVREALAKAGGAQPPSDPHAAVTFAEGEVDKARSQYREKILSSVREVIPVKDYTFKEIGSSLSAFFFVKTREIVAYAFILAAILVFLLFRSFAPSFAVIFGASADIVMTLGGMSLFGIPLTLASVAALLMLIGLSLDTDVMLTMRILKRTEGTARERAYEALKTGLLMNCSAIAAFTVLSVVALWLGISTYWEIGAVVVMGCFADFVATWMVNAPLVLNAAEKGGRQ